MRKERQIGAQLRGRAAQVAHAPRQRHAREEALDARRRVRSWIGADRTAPVDALASSSSAPRICWAITVHVGPRSRIEERDDRHLAAVLAERCPLARLVGEREVRRGAPSGSAAPSKREAPALARDEVGEDVEAPDEHPPRTVATTSASKAALASCVFAIAGHVRMLAKGRDGFARRRREPERAVVGRLRRPASP